MVLTAGTHLGPYEIVGALGAGGMGEVYHARDTRLKRDVALKVLPSALAGDPDRLGRFQREAELLAALNHPHIAQIYGLVDSDPSALSPGSEQAGSGPGGVRALVMELVDGQTLAECIARCAGSEDPASNTGSPRASGPGIPLDEALAIARQLAEALEYAHERGIVHRDLKPANIKVTPDGAVKVLDFGLAKALATDLTATIANDVDAAASPTMTTPFGAAQGGPAMTQAGAILGTATYMSPEQARGMPADKRADIWAFGAVLYEMLTGRAVFAGETMTDVLGAIVHKDPDWSALPADTPPAVRRLLARCLMKERRQRLRDIGDARLEIEESDTASVAVAPAPAGWWPWLTAATAALAITAILVAAWALRRESPLAGLSQYDVVLADDAPITFTQGSPWGEGWTALDISPRGDFVVYVAGRGDRTEVWYRSLIDSTTRPLPGTEGAYQLALDPDGSSVAFITGTRLELAAIGAGTVTELGQVRRPVGMTWLSRDRLLVADTDSFVLEFDRLGGPPLEVTHEGSCYNPSAIAAREVLCGRIPDGVFRLNLDDGKTHRVRVSDGTGAGRLSPLLLGSMPALLPDGHLLYSAPDGSILGAMWSPESTTASRRTAVLAGVRTEGVTGSRQSAVSASGTLVFVPGSSVALGQLVRRRDEGEPELLPIRPLMAGQFDVNRDGRRLAVTSRTVSGMELSVYDMTDGARTPWIVDGYAELVEPRWSPDGSKLAVFARRDADDAVGMTLVGPPSTGADPERLSGAAFMPSHWYEDGRLLGYTSLGSVSSAHQALVRVRLEGASATAETIESSRSQNRAVLSPDGRLMALMSADEIVVETVADDRTHRTAVGRGLDPLWLDNRTVVYRDGNTWYRAAVRPDGSLAGRPQSWFADPQFIDTDVRSHALTPAGEVIYLRSGAKTFSTYLRVIPRWTASVAAAIEAAAQR